MGDPLVTFKVRRGIAGGDCFFYSVAQGLQELKIDCNVKSLREVCKQFAQSQLQDEQSWLKKALKIEQETIDKYIKRIEFTANDVEKKSRAVKKLGLESPIWGRSEIEGRIICAEYKVKLHVLKDDVNGKQGMTQHIIDSEGSRLLNVVNWDDENNTVHIINTTNLHFKPMLRHKVQCNMDDYNVRLDDKDKIKPRKTSKVTARVPINFDVKEPVALFTGRTKELENLHKILQSAGTAVISQMTSVTYLGGVGKSELARKYISEYSNKYDDNVIWINAENYLTIAESFATVAENKLGINIFDKMGKRMETHIIVREVYEHFARMQRSLFVFDNTGKYKGYGDRDVEIDKFLPSGPHKPHVLITSRDQEWAEMMTIKLNVFSEEEAAEFITKALTDITEVEESEVRRLAAELQYLPLTLTQAVAYIKMENKSEEGRFTIGNYLKLFKEKASEFSAKGSITENCDCYIESLMTVWKVTVEKIEQKRSQGGEQAVNILKVIAYLAPVKIPIDLIFCKLINMTEAGHNAVELLDQYSMASIKDGMLYVHRLVQRVTILELEGQGKNQEVIQETFTLLRESFPYGRNKFDDISRKKELLPQLEMFLFHIDCLLKNKTKGTPNIEIDILRELFTWTADGYTDLGDPKKIQEWLEMILIMHLNYSESNLGEVANTLKNLGNAYRALGDHSKQMKLLELILKVQEKMCGPNDYEIIKTLSNLANAYGDLGNHFEKKKQLERALKILVDLYGPNHFQVAIMLANLGNVCGALGDHHEKKVQLKLALKIQSDKYGPNHFQVAKTLNDLGNAYGALGKHCKKKKLLKKALEIKLNFYGSNHLEVALTLINLANCYENLGDYSKMRELRNRARAIMANYELLRAK